MGRGCGGGGLRILPHKSWNVYGFDNKLRVKQDEAKHAEEEEKMRVYTRRVDAEKRLEVMRRKRSQADDGEQKNEDGDEDQLDEEAKDDGNDSNNHDHDEYADEDAAPARPASKRRNLGGSYRSTSSVASSASRYTVVQEDEAEDESSHANDASTTAAAATTSSPSSAPPPQHFTLFPDIVGSMKAQEIARVREEDKRKKEMSEIRKYASATMFVEALRAPEDGSAASSSRPGASAVSSSNTLRPWYAQSHHERDAHSHRSQELNKKRLIVRRHGADGKMHVERNLSGQHASTVMNDPLERMKERMREEREKEKREEEEKARKQEITIKMQSPFIPPSQHHTSSHIVSSASSLIAAALPPPSRHISTDSMPPLQSATASSPFLAANDLNSPPPLDTLSSNELRRVRWNGTTVSSTHSPSTSTTTLDSSMHFTPNVGFTNSSHEEVQRQLEQQHVRPLFPSALAIINSSSAAIVSHSSISRADRRDTVTISSSSSSESDSDSDSSSTSSHRSSKSKKKHKKKHEKEKKSKKRSKKSSKKRRRDVSSDESSSDEDDASDEESHKKSRKKDRKKQKKSSSSKKDKKSSTRKEETKRSKSSAHSRDIDASSPPAPVPSSSFLSLTELRAERETREREERQKTAALLGVPHWATADRGAIRVQLR